MRQVKRLQKELDRFVSGETGIPYDALIWFAEPLFELYQADPRPPDGSDRFTRDVNELGLQVAVLETARLFMAYVLLEPAEAERRYMQLERSLIGRDACERERIDFLELLHLMEERWYDLDESVQARIAEAFRHAAPFHVLLERYADTLSPAETSPDEERYGPDRLDLPEAMALFSRPLLEHVHVLEDPDLLEDALARAGAYWNLVQLKEERYEERLARIVKQFAKSPDDERRIAEEALRMAAWFYELFPERRTR